VFLARRSRIVTGEHGQEQNTGQGQRTIHVHTLLSSALHCEQRYVIESGAIGEGTQVLQAG